MYITSNAQAIAHHPEANIQFIHVYQPIMTRNLCMELNIGCSALEMRWQCWNITKFAQRIRCQIHTVPWPW